MITRGHYIGEIIDEFATIAEQARLRNRLGVFDLSVYAENFFRDVLNNVLGTNLINLNKDRSNEPGLDLGDAQKSIAFQVTSTATSEKVNSTLKTITSGQAQRYSTIVVLVIGKRQSSYTLDKGFSKKYAFSAEQNIWDLDVVARKAMDLEIDALQNLHRMIRKNVAKLRIELEIADDEGNYPTSSYTKWEERLSPEFGSMDAFVAFYESDVSELDDDAKKKIKSAVHKLGKQLSRLPRVTREFLAVLLERQESGESRRHPNGLYPWLLEAKARREYHGSDFKEELEILESAGLASVEFDDPHECGPPEIVITLSTNDDLATGFSLFVQKREFSYRQIIGHLDFSAF